MKKTMIFLAAAMVGWSLQSATAQTTASSNTQTPQEQVREGLKAYNNKDYAKAFEWWTKAANQGNAGAMYNLGFLYRNGYGVTKDIVKAVEWWTKAAENNYDARKALTKHYYNLKDWERVVFYGKDVNDFLSCAYKGVAYFQLKNYAAAENSFKSAIKSKERDEKLVAGVFLLLGASRWAWAENEFQGKEAGFKKKLTALSAYATAARLGDAEAIKWFDEFKGKRSGQISGTWERTYTDGFDVPHGIVDVIEVSYKVKTQYIFDTQKVVERHCTEQKNKWSEWSTDDTYSFAFDGNIGLLFDSDGDIEIFFYLDNNILKISKEADADNYTQLKKIR